MIILNFAGSNPAKLSQIKHGVYMSNNKSRERNKKWRDEHKQYISEYNKNYRLNHIDNIRDNKRQQSYQAKYRKLYPWKLFYYRAKNRCRKPNGEYSGRVKFLMNMEDFRKLWFRDRAWLLKKPSIDRIDNNGDYVYINCRFIEFLENARLGSLVRKQQLKELKRSEEMKAEIKKILKEVYARAIIGYPPLDERDELKTLNVATSSITSLIIKWLEGKKEEKIFCSIGTRRGTLDRVRLQ